MSKSYSSEIVYSIPLTHPDKEKGKYVATIVYQIPRRIVLHGRSKTSPRFDTLYGVIYWLNKQPYNLEYTIYRTNKNDIIKEGSKRIGEDIV